MNSIYTITRFAGGQQAQSMSTHRRGDALSAITEYREALDGAMPFLGDDLAAPADKQGYTLKIAGAAEGDHIEIHARRVV